MSTNETAVGPTPTSVLVSPQPSVVSDQIYSNSPNASPLSGASTPFVNPDSTPAIQGNAPIAAVKVAIGQTGNSTSVGLPSVQFSNPA